MGILNNKLWPSGYDRKKSRKPCHIEIFKVRHANHFIEI